MSFGEEAEEEEEMVNQVSQVLKYKSLWLAVSLIVVQLFKYLKKKKTHWSRVWKYEVSEV